MKQQNKLSQQKNQAVTQQNAQQSEQRSELEFATPEDMLRYDAARTMVPPGIAQKLQQSTASLPQPPQSWWKKLFGK